MAKKCTVCEEILEKRVGVPGDMDICVNCCGTKFVEVKEPDKKAKSKKKK